MSRVLPVAAAVSILWAGAAAAQQLALPPIQPLPPVQPLPPGGAAAPGAPSTGLCMLDTLFRGTIRNISPGLAAADRAAQPRSLWRFGSTFLRSEEQPDPVRGNQMLTIVAEPDIWAINLTTGVGQHSVDPGPDFTVHAPILPPAPDLPPPLRTLEYGCEPEFVKQYAPQPQQLVKWGPIQATLHAAVFGDHAVIVLMDQRRVEPIMVSYMRQGRPVYVVRYDEWRRGLPNRPEMFVPPKNARITEAPAVPPGGAPGEPAEPPLIPLDKAGRTPFS
ncbi:MAG: hypothetical protein DI570_21525 [Phenylobacterium zucineum]|nr:MAG: hypothetical protein DI570_21525 [Phenylobacterium zucineum]